jgi:hypothetical protein
MEEAIGKWPTIDKDRFHDDVEKNTVSIYNILSILYKPLSS